MREVKKTMNVANNLSDHHTLFSRQRRGRIYRMCVITTFVALILVTSLAHAKEDNLGKTIVMKRCTVCHRLEGDPMPRRTKQAPDLIWAGNKYQEEWLGKWLQNPDEKLYPLGFDYKAKRKGRHLSLSPSKAGEVVDFLQTIKDPRVKKGVMRSGTAQELKRGKQLYQEHACQNCHWTPASNRRGYTGGKSSTSLIKMGARLQADWVYRFNQNPNDFVPDSGAYIPKPPLPEKDIYAITAYMMTFK